MAERCFICGCTLHREKGTYARPDVKGRSHATENHFVPERFFGRSTNRRGTKTEGIFETCPWGYEGKTEVFCYECHEELLHNPVLLPQDIERFAEICRSRGLDEDSKSKDRSKIAGRIKLLREVIAKGLAVIRADGERGAS
ncbi:MAG: hypothetical protein WB402_00150 [Sulfuricaulis sp.]|uniref:hypothetical protein n=1 Tax=Sulfuricaulis sp. TaxID=2003553 RepID=UPI003C384EC4